MDNLVNYIQHLLASDGLLVIFLIGVIEEVVFIIPSSLIFLAAGVLLIDPSASFASALVTATTRFAFFGALGVTVGSFMMYGLFYWGGKWFLDNYGRYFGIDWKEVENINNKFTSGYTDELTILFLRAIPIWSMTLVSSAAGLIRIPWKSFGFYTFLGTFIRLTVLGLFGWKFGSAYHYFADRLDEAQIYGTIILLGAVAAFLVYVYKRRK